MTISKGLASARSNSALCGSSISVDPSALAMLAAGDGDLRDVYAAGSHTLAEERGSLGVGKRPSRQYIRSTGGAEARSTSAIDRLEGRGGSGRAVQPLTSSSSGRVAREWRLSLDNG
jgi:hypothetical protein